jgi:hypothetical protein
MKQSAVEWYFKQMQSKEKFTQDEFDSIYQQAKEMEEEQQGYSEEDMTEAFRIGFNLGCNAVESLTNEIAEEWFKNGLKKFKNK